MKTFSIRAMLVFTLILALAVVFFFAPFTFEYPVINSGGFLGEKDSLIMRIDCEIDADIAARLDLDVSDFDFYFTEEVEIDEYQLTDSKTHVILKMTLLEYILLERKNPSFELNPEATGMLPTLPVRSKSKADL